MAAIDGGSLREHASQHLRVVWAREAARPGTNVQEIADQVASSLNTYYNQGRQRFLRGLRLGPLSLSPLGRLICWDFEVAGKDVLHALHNLDPPSKRVVRWRGVDVGKLLATIIPLGDGGSTRARFQLRAICNPHSGTSESHGNFWRAHLPRVASLYLTAIAVRYGMTFLRSYTLYKIAGKVWSYMRYLLTSSSSAQQAVQRINLGATISWLGTSLLRVWLLSLIHDYPKTMLPRMPMLQVRLHRAMLEDGHLTPQDYTFHRVQPVVRMGSAIIDVGRLEKWRLSARQNSATAAAEQSSTGQEVQR